MRPGWLRFDPRTTMLLLLLCSVLTLLVDVAGLFWLVAGTSAYLLLTGMWRQAMTGVCVFVLLYLAQYGIVEYATGPMLMLGFMLFFAARIMPVAMLAQRLAATPPGELVGALQRLRTPRALVLPCAVILRFLPTIGSEFAAIRDGMKLRGLSALSWRTAAHPMMVVESIYVPLLMRSMKVSDDLSVSAATRGADNPGHRTSLRQLRFQPVDVIAAACAITALGWVLADQLVTGTTI